MFAILTKIIGGLCVIFGFFMIVLFPGISTRAFQRSSFSWAGMLIGIISILLGIYLLKM